MSANLKMSDVWWKLLGEMGQFKLNWIIMRVPMCTNKWPLQSSLSRDLSALASLTLLLEAGRFTLAIATAGFSKTSCTKKESAPEDLSIEQLFQINTGSLHCILAVCFPVKLSKAMATFGVAQL